ncbi:DUF4214 domain-containing protein [Achromobacter sp. GG226]|uniref:DUF4214 domain-containing protein n=1 Tax=Verticiella alkaliphila TaxID=2779529 RepID=UPI001C0D8970|nr:DUF4214 domain-containing protein [Verticiella sp. GG226]MBU4610300.1 DUF4214 domain-containing protein [Verticiella sp. GG226]
MALTRAQAITQIELFQRNYLPSDKTAVKDWTAVVDAGISRGNTTIEASMQVIIRQMISDVGYYQNAFPSHPPALWVIDTSTDLANSVKPSELIAYFYPNASTADSAALVTALSTGTITSIDFLTGWLPARIESASPSAADVLEAIFDAGLGTPMLPDIDLALPGVTDAQTEFLIGIYVAAFDRAPEHTGLAYWANDLATLLANGMSEPDAMKQMAKAMYVAGAENGENGTSLDHAAYVRFVYDTVLGREPDVGGATYWTEQLQAGADRSTFIAPFLTSALAAAGDSSYVSARIAVAEYAAQAHVSGPGKSVDLVKVLSEVSTTGDAYLAIQALANAYPTSAAAVTATVAKFITFALEPEDVDLAAFGADTRHLDDSLAAFQDASAQEITVVGVGAEPDAAFL